MSIIRNLVIVAELIDPFDLLKNIDVSQNKLIRENAASAYRFITAIGILGLVISLIVGGIKLTNYKSGDNRSKLKDILGYKVILGFFFFGFVAIAGLIYPIIKSMIN